MNDALRSLLSTSSLRAFLAVALAAVALAGCGAATPCGALPERVSFDDASGIAVRVSGATVWAAARASGEPRPVWTLPTRAAVERVVVRALPARGGFEVEVRVAASTWRGELDADRRARTPLELVPEPSAALDARDAGALSAVDAASAAR